MNSVYEAARAERAAQQALVEARAARIAAQKEHRLITGKGRDKWFERQLEIASAGAPVVEQVVVRANYGPKIGAPVLWDIICLTKGELTRRREPVRRKADDYARSLRTRGHDVRVKQTGY